MRAACVAVLFLAGSGTISLAAAAQCPNSVEPLVSLAGVGSFYTSQTTQSVVDPQRAAEYNRLTWQYDVLLDRMLELTHLAERDHDLAVDCTLSQLARWAEAGALTQGIATQPGVERRQAAMIQAWVLAAGGSLMERVDGDAFRSDPRFKTILAWMLQLAQNIRGEFIKTDGRPDWLNRTSNHSHWAGLAMLRVGILSGNDALTAAGLAERDAAITAIADDGSLPAEMERGQRALAYVNFALVPLLGLVDTARRYGWDISAEQRLVLERAIDFGIGVNRDPEHIANIVGVTQVGFNVTGSLAWLPMAARISGHSQADLASGLIVSRAMLENKYLGVVP